MAKRMAKRVFASVPDYLAKLLEWKAEKDGRSLSNLVSLLLELHASELQQEYEAEQNKGAKR